MRCPQCGKPNPADRETCQYCQARLTPAPAAPQDNDLPDWLRASQPGGAAGGDLFTPGGASDEALPDWLAGLGFPAAGEPTPASAVPSGGAESPDWLGGLMGAAAPAGAESEGPAAETPDFDRLDSSDWLARLGGSETPPAAEASSSETPAELDWLNLEAPAAPAGQPAGQVELPDWLTGAAETPATENRTAPGPAETLDWSSPETAIPDWLMSDQPAAGQESAQPQAGLPAAQSAAGEADLDDWLASLGDLQGKGPTEAFAASPDQPGASAPQAQPAGEFPDWFMSAEESSPAGQAVESAAGPAASAGETGLPDWMLTLDAAEADAAAPAGEPSTGSEAPEWLSDASLDWLAAERQSSETGAPSANTAPPFGAALEGDLSWLTDLEAGAKTARTDFGAQPTEEEGAAGAAGLMAEGAFPAWMTSEPPPEAAPSQPLAGESGEAGLRPAELPEWLQAMRPVGVAGVAAPEEEGPVPGAGPLAGLRNVLPAEPDISQTQKPPVYSVRMEVSDLHQAHTDLLQSLLAAEGQPRPIPGRPAISSLAVLRTAIAVLLMLTILAALVTGIPAARAPLAPPEVVALVRLVDNLPQGAPVLLAVDYEPGFSGEMDALTGSVAAHLARKGAFITLVSTVPTGPVQAEHLLAQVARVTAAEPQSANLGYIAGGPTGLSGFAQAPRQVLPQAMNGERVWIAPPLQSVNRLADFRLVLFATENPETARAWIEQARPALNSRVPLVALVSAQAEPLVRPYYAAHPAQLEALVGGLAGGAAYDSATRQAGPASQFWGPFNLGMLVAGLLMFAAIVFNLITARLAGRSENPRSEGKR